MKYPLSPLHYFWIGLWLVLGLSLSGCRVAGSSAPAPQIKTTLSETRQACHVLKVFDGDTFACDLNQNGRFDADSEKVRLLGIDSPEMHYSKKNKTGHDEPFAAQASAYALQTLRHQTVYLEWDQKPQDRYGRQLAFVYLKADSSTSLNQTLLEQGLAKILIIPPNVKYEALLRQAEASAQAKHLGMWQSAP